MVVILPKVLNNSMKGLINLKNKDHKCFMWCHVRLINPQNRKVERINKQNKKIAPTKNTCQNISLKYWNGKKKMCTY